MPGRTIPTFPGFKLSTNDRYEYASEGRLFRLGIKLNTPNMCNWSCPYCYVGNPEATDRPRLFDTDELANTELHKDPTWADRMEGWIHQGIDLGVKAITLNGTFEPTTSPDLFRIITFCRKNNLFVTLVTNGGKLNKPMLQELYDLGINLLTKINIPLVESDDSRYDTFCSIQQELSGQKRDARQAYEDQKRLIYMLMEVGFNKEESPDKTRMGVESVITTSNMQYLPELVGQLRERNIYSHIEVTKVQGFAKNNNHLVPTRDEIHNLFQQILQRDIEMGFEAWEPRPPYVAGACHENLFRLDVHANGKVKPCPGIETTVGDLNSQPMADIIEGDALGIIRNLEQHIQGDCKNCDLFASRECYGGCRGTVYQTLKSHGLSEYEAWVGSDPSCWRVKNVLDNGKTVEDLQPFAKKLPLVQITSPRAAV